MGEYDAKQDKRIHAILGNSRQQGFDSAVKVYFEHLRRTLKLPCEVTGIEDFQWEEFYVIGPGNPREYERLRKNQPSYEDTFELQEIEFRGVSKWMMFGGDDIAAQVKRKSDGKEFTLGLAELKAVSKKSPNYQLLHDFSVFLVNYR